MLFYFPRRLINKVIISLAPYIKANARTQASAFKGEKTVFFSHSAGS
jgi:hypothetical protein